MREKIRSWWHGKQEYDPDYGPSGPFKRHFTSQIARRVVSCIASDWRWLITTAIAAVAAVASVMGLRR